MPIRDAAARQRHQNAAACRRPKTQCGHPPRETTANALAELGTDTLEAPAIVPPREQGTEARSGWRVLFPRREQGTRMRSARTGAEGRLAQAGDAGRTGDGGVFGMGRRLRGIRRRATRTGDGGAFGMAIAFPERPSRTHLRPLFAPAEGEITPPARRACR